MKKMYIIGFGMGDVEHLSEEVKSIIDNASYILTTKRISLKIKQYEALKLSEIYERLELGFDSDVVVLVSGDVGFFSMSSGIVKKFQNDYDIQLINGFSSLQYFSAKLKINYDDAKVVSMHGRNNNIIGDVTYNKKVFILTGGENNVQSICLKLCEFGLGNLEVFVGESLSYKNERITTGTALELSKISFNDLAVMYIINTNFSTPNITLYDTDFIRGDVPMTKEEVRWICLKKLNLQPKDIVYDIGSGTGSIAIESAKGVYQGMVYAIEQNETACSLILDNIRKHQTFNVKVINKKAPEGLDSLEKPDKVIIGGSSGNMSEIIERLLQLNEDVKIIATAITLETLNSILESFKFHNLKYDCTCINASKSRHLGQYNMMIANNPIYIFTGEKL